MKYNLILIMFCLPFVASAQKIDISIQSSYTEEYKSIGQELKIEFIEETNKCNTEGFLSIDEQIDKLSHELNLVGIPFSKFSEHKLLINNNQGNKIKKFTFKTNNIDETTTVLEVCKDNFIKVNSLDYIFESKQLSDQDERMIKAIEETRKTVEVYAKKLNKKSIKIVSIDDDTSGSFSRFSYDYLYMLSTENKFNKPTRNSTYSVLVNYILE